MAIVAAAIAALALAGGVTGCTEDVEKSLKQLERAAARNDKALNRKVARVPIGASVDAARKRLGRPDSYELTETGAGKTQTLYYGQWRLVFRDGKLVSKNKS
jgi:hypothetical protein